MRPARIQSPKQKTHMLAQSKERVLAVLACLGILAILSGATSAAPTEALPESLLTSKNALSAEATNTPEYVVVKPIDQVTYSSETAASIALLPVFEGSRFKTGDILLKMDCRLQQAELEKTQAQADAAAIADTSAKKLKSYGSISQMELVKAHSEALIAKADVDKLKALVDKCVIKAPFNGAVATLMVHPLESVKPGDPLIKIVNLEHLEFEIVVPSAWLKWLKIDSTFNVNINETGKTVQVVVVRIDPEIESVSQTVKITGVIKTPDPSLLPGMSGQAIFPDNPDQPNLAAEK
jgi:RND family efflux transporter MFP subunit